MVDTASISKFPVNVVKLTLTLHTHADAQRRRLRRVGKARQSAPDVGARRLGQDEQYLTVREILSEASTLVPPWAGLSRERSDYYRFGYATLGLSIWVTVFRLWRSSQGWFHELK